jgi:hypothetical protein
MISDSLSLATGHNADHISYVSAYLGDPLLAPVHAILNTLIGLVIFVIITTIGISYSGALYAESSAQNYSKLTRV